MPTKIQTTDCKFFVAVTGGGLSFISKFSVPGASKNLVGAIVPYDKTLFEKFVGGEVDKFASEEGAFKLAKASYNEVLEAGHSSDKAIGIGVSCSLATLNERPGRAHKVHIVFYTKPRSYFLSVEMDQSRTREQEEELVCKWIFEELYALLSLDDEASYTIMTNYNFRFIENEK